MINADENEDHFDAVKEVEEVEAGADDDAPGLIAQAVFVHGNNLARKEADTKKYNDEESQQFLAEIRVKYDEWHQNNVDLEGPHKEPSQGDKEIVEKRVRLFSEYKDYVDQRQYAEKFDSRSNLHSSVLEEFIYYLFRDLLEDFDGEPLVGKSHAFKDMFFFPTSYQEMLQAPSARIEIKDHDFIIGTKVNTKMQTAGSDTIQDVDLEIPAVAIECKTYLDKTMLEGSSTAAEQLKHKSPNAVYIVVMEWLKLTSRINLKKYKVDQIYVFRKQKNTDREFRYEDGYEKKPIDLEVVWHLYEFVRGHLTGGWGGGVDEGLERGWLL